MTGEIGLATFVVNGEDGVDYFVRAEDESSAAMLLAQEHQMEDGEVSVARAPAAGARGVLDYPEVWRFRVGIASGGEYWSELVGVL